MTVASKSALRSDPEGHSRRLGSLMLWLMGVFNSVSQWAEQRLRQQTGCSPKGLVQVVFSPAAHETPSASVARGLTETEHHEVQLQKKTTHRVKVTPFLNGSITNLKVSVCWLDPLSAGRR